MAAVCVLLGVVAALYCFDAVDGVAAVDDVVDFIGVDVIHCCLICLVLLFVGIDKYRWLGWAGRGKTSRRRSSSKSSGDVSLRRAAMPHPFSEV